MSSASKIIQAAAGNAAGEGLYVEEVFSTYLYEGTGSAQTITNDIDLDGEGGLVWLKNRDASGAANIHGLFDTERGTSARLDSSSSDAEASQSGVTAFNSNGFAIGDSGSFNRSSESIASWTFRKAPKFFDVVTYTGTGSTQNISHNLGSTVGSIFIKRTDNVSNWFVFHRSIPAANNAGYLLLDDTAALGTSNTIWNNTAPTDSVFTVGANNNVNTSGATYVAYLFAHNDGDGEFGESGDQDIIKCGSYTGNGGASEFEVNLGWEAQFVLVKNANNSSAPWIIFDAMRSMSETERVQIYPNTSDAEATGSAGQTGLIASANGFKIRLNNSYFNGNGEDHIYIAIRRGPMKTPESGTEVFAVNADDNGDTFSVGFPTDAYLFNIRGGNSLNSVLADRLRGNNKYLVTNSTAVEATSSGDGIARFDFQDDFDQNISGSSNVGYNFRRAPGFFDVVAYAGTGGNSGVKNHNLGVVPELIIVKSRTRVAEWPVWATGFQVGIESDYLLLNDNAAKTTSLPNSNFPFFAEPTDSTFTLGDWSRVNDSGEDYIAYLFATLAGVSKVGSYTGNGTSQTIDCGFSAGARFVLIKSTGVQDWHVFDTERGIISGNDPRLELNTDSAEQTNADFLNSDSSGFAVTSDTAVNNSGTEYIFLAIA